MAGVVRVVEGNGRGHLFALLGSIKYPGLIWIFKKFTCVVISVTRLSHCVKQERCSCQKVER
jgi:hypothetical protein